MRRELWIIAFAALLFPLPAVADCSTVTMGTKPTGYVFHNADADVLQVCKADGTWQALGPVSAAAPDPCAGSPSPGTTCADGSVYAGLSPDGNVPMYTTPADAPSLLTWNNGNTGSYPNIESVQIASTQCDSSNCQSTGEANTSILVSTDSDTSIGGQQPHVAAEYCADLVAHGRSDWYLPARNEIMLLYDNRVEIGGFVTTGSACTTCYWYSNQIAIPGVAGIQYFAFDTQSNTWAYNTHRVRCVRK